MVVPSSDHSFSIAPGSKVAKLLTDNSTTVAYDTAIDINIESASFSKEFFLKMGQNIPIIYFLS